MRKDFGECIASQREDCGETLESRDGPGFFLELLDLATSSATPESEEMEAVVQNKNEKKFTKAPAWEKQWGQGSGYQKEKTCAF